MTPRRRNVCLYYVFANERCSAAKETIMNSTTDKIKGNANEGIGKAKEKLGEATGSEKLQGEGVLQQVKGQGQKTLGDAKDAVNEGAKKVADALDKRH
jgi:uncharacterized protein YjbJ (UPF0337 family)